ncbi:MAG: GIY-YIG nuclease family protein [Candidatus Marinimicrobia bacterium]|nr:GIY-YIG nuclease family protein [Candidatus Neomarinimicrobiota bacterium]
MSNHNYYVYILSNKYRTVFYTGVTNNLYRKMYEHKFMEKVSFCHRYKCFDLIYYEWHMQITHAIDREKQIKRWRREKKIKLIKTINPEFKSLNHHASYD